MRLSHEWAQQCLAVEKQRLYSAIESMPQGLVLFDADERLVVCNQRYLQIYNHNGDEVRPGCDYRDVVASSARARGLEGDVERYCAERRRRMHEGKPFETTIPLPDGREIRILNHPAEDGGWVSIHEDITARLQFARERDRDREFLNAVVESVPTAIMVKDAESLKYTLVNKAGLEYLGLPRDEAIGKTSSELWPAYEAARIQAADAKALSAGYLFTGEHHLDAPGRGERIVTSQRLLIRDTEGAPKYLLTVIEDVTERKQSEERIAHLAHHDVLTGLPNRILFRERLEKSLRRLRAEDDPRAALSRSRPL